MSNSSTQEPINNLEILQKEFKAIESIPSNEEFAKRLGKLIRCYREKRSWTQEKLASQVGMDKSYISKIENGQVPPEKTLKNISKALSLSLEGEGGELFYLRLKAANPESITVLERKRFSSKD